MSELSSSYQKLIGDIQATLAAAQTQAAQQVNQVMVQAYWAIGQHIVEFEQGGSDRASYGSYLIDRLAKDLRQGMGRGFSRSNLRNMRSFYLAYPIRQTLSGELGWSHL